MQQKNTNRQWYVALGLMFVLAFLLRWFQLPEKLFFGFEQGRDALIIENIRHLQDFVLVGPKTDIGGIFHGAWYYYLMTIPYEISGGSPVGAVFFLVLISSLVPLMMAQTLRDMTKSSRMGIVAGILSLFSFELISYSQWLSNVTPAVPVMSVTLWSIWRLSHTNQQKYWLLSGLSAAFAAQFEIILLLWFGPLFLSLLLTRVIRLPKFKTVVLLLLGAAFLFAPMILFNLRNEFVSLKAVTTYQTANVEAEPISFLGRLTTYGDMLERLVKKSLWYVPGGLAMGLTFITIWAASRWHRLKQGNHAYTILGLWTIMTWPVIFFPHSMTLTQLYVGTSLGLIGLTVLAVAYFTQLKWGRAGMFILGVFWIASTVVTLGKLQANEDVFYRTIQEDLLYRDQIALLAYINSDAGAAPYRLKAFTIPYFQEEGWQYLHQHLYPHATPIGANVIYVVIEEKVDPYWIEKWIGELGPTELVSEEWFGRLRVQKRAITSESSTSDTIEL
jgi:hypothetical protein